MVDFLLRPATSEDQRRIRSLVWRVRINPFGLHWRNFVVAIDDRQRLLGCGQLKPHGLRTIELASIAVIERFRGRGVARAIIEHLLARAPRPLYLLCPPELTPFYARFGFESAGSRPLPLHFRRVRRFIRVASLLRSSHAPVVMALD